MFKNYIKIAFRNLKRNWIYSIINISGLAIGIACCIMIYLFVDDELSYDKFHKNDDTLFRLVKKFYNNADGSLRFKGADMYPAIASVLDDYFPEIKHSTLCGASGGVVQYEDKIFRETVSLANTPFFQMFSFSLIKGNPEAVLEQDNGIVLSHSYAEKYFGNEDPIGKILTIAYGQTKKQFIVTGIVQDVPQKSSIKFNMMVHISNMPMAYGRQNFLTNWDSGWWDIPIYIQLNKDASIDDIEKKFYSFTEQYFQKHIQKSKNEGYWTREGIPFSFGLQPIKDIYIDAEVNGKGMTTSYVLIGIAVIVLALACINFINLTIGMSSVRSTEIGIRKVAGAVKKQLITQFLTESLIITSLGLITGLICVILLIPEFGVLSAKQLSISALFDFKGILILGCVFIFTGIINGCYPAMVMAGVMPSDIIKGNIKIGGRKPVLRSLVVFQFTISVILIISGLLINEQSDFLQNKDLGYKKEGLIVIRTQDPNIESSQRLVNLFRNNVKDYADVIDVTSCYAPIGLGRWPRGGGGRNSSYCHYNRVDSHIINTLGLTITAGRGFNETENTNAAIVNKSFLDEYGLVFTEGMILNQELITKTNAYDFLLNTKIVGVIEDYHFSLLHHEIIPAIYYLNPRLPLSTILVRVSTNNVQGTMSYFKKTWKTIQPEKPFLYYFQEDALAESYSLEQQWSSIIKFSSALAVVVACMGIFGLTVLAINKRVKEIGIRKVLGARVSQIINLILKDFIGLVLIANIIAWPCVYYIIQEIFQKYPYRISIEIYYFILAGVGSVLIAAITIAYLAVKAALANPVKSLRYE